MTEPVLKTGEYVETHGSFNGGGIYEAHSPQIEKILGDVAETRPAVEYPKTAAAKAKYLAKYKEYDARYNEAARKTIAAYKADMPRFKTQAMRVQIAKQITRVQGWINDSKDVMKWMEKMYGPR